MIVQDADLEYDPADYAGLLDAAVREKAQVVYRARDAGAAYWIIREEGTC